MKDRDQDHLMLVILRSVVCSMVSSIVTILPLMANEGREKKDVPPNVILILADDLGMGDIAIFNGGLNHTPRLDQLVSESVWFTQAYSASAVCAPARAALMTGRYPHRTGVVGLNMKNFPTLTSLNRKEITIADIFSNNGYHTGLVGKWHLGHRPEYHPMKRGFKEFAGFMEAFSVNTYYDYKLDINGIYKEYQGAYLTDVLTQYAIDFVNRHKTDPFFLHLAYYAPHRPLGAPEELVTYYENRGYDSQTAKIYAMIEVMDSGIGLLVDELDRLGIRDNTIIIFASDNGPDPLTSKRFNQELRGSKYDVFEGGIRVPLLFHWKDKLTADVTGHLAHFTDILPTLTDLCQLEIHDSVLQRIDGMSLADLLQKKTDSVGVKTRYWQWNRGVPYYTHNAALRDGEWKLVYPSITTGIVYQKSELKPLLFDIKQDPVESTDVSSQHPEVYMRLKTLLEDWSRKMEIDRLRATSFDN